MINNADFDKQFRSFKRIAGVGWLASLAIGITIWSAIGWTAFHFISKYW